MPLQYDKCVKVFLSAVLVCGMIYLTGHHRLAGWLLMAIGAVAMALTVGSCAGSVDVMAKGGRAIPPAVFCE
jgi:hypothetical protein